MLSAQDKKIIDGILSNGSSPAQLYLYYSFDYKNNYEVYGVATDKDNLPINSVLLYEISYPSLTLTTTLSFTHSNEAPHYLEKIIRALEVKKKGFVFFYDSEQPNSFEFIHYPIVPTPAPVTPCFIYDIESQTLIKLYEPQQSNTLNKVFDTIKQYCKQQHQLNHYSCNLWTV